MDVLNRANEQSRYRILVRALDLSPEVVTLAPDLDKIQPGDVLVEFGGRSADDALEELFAQGSGTNNSGSLRRALELLSLRPQQLVPLPAEDAVQLKLERPGSGVYEVTIPWLSQVDAACVKGEGARVRTDSEPPARRFKPNITTGLNELHQLYASRFGTVQDSIRLFEVEPSAEPTLRYGKLETPQGLIGYLGLTSFVPQKLTPQELLAEISRLLRNELADTVGLVFDVRDNGGGMIPLAEQIPQLFSSKHVQVEGFRMVNSPTNEQIVGWEFFKNTIWNRLMQEVKGASAPLSAVGQHTSDHEANSLSQAYYGPVAVLTNGSCYSACDMFTSMMQDNGLAEIWGENRKTGAGGATVVPTPTLLYFQGSNPGPFSPLPGQQAMGISWMQAVRAGESPNELLEDYGVTRDQDATPTDDDVLSGGAGQFNRIAARLAALASTPRPRVELEGGESRDVVLGQPIAWPASVSNTDAISYVVEGAVIGRQDVAEAEQGSVVLQIPLQTTTYGYADVEVRGSLRGARGWRLFPELRVVPAPLEVPGAGLLLDFASADPAPIVVYSRATSSQGWSVQDGALTTTRGTEYPPSMQSVASLFIDLRKPGPARLDLDATVQTEEGFDFFILTVRSAGQSTELLRQSGNFPNQKLAFDLQPFVGNEVEIRFEFMSDPAVNGPGVRLDNIQVKRAR